MHKQETLDQIFRLLRAGEQPEAQILELSQSLETDDVTWMMECIGKLQGPQEYFDASDWEDDRQDAKSGIVVKGFFLFIDLVSALILELGDEAIEVAQRFERSSSQYVPWVLKNCTDGRFTKQLRESFPYLGI